ncbi:MAG TPA: bifunctional UDP-sugar hydrolase/5'-nucleotidase [Pyrinomonadaceae bacterium]|jgi:2',3'-cyclic-nucleotide 2'-phosphodiesterase/3'-nucleotidase|nr:bifunctional UDP-sugar hydrolase/5'-nucleotidase [Pyrinomonadaceae bacterium]
MDRHSSARSLPTLLLLSLALLTVFAPAQTRDAAAKRAWITILSTTDLHGNILPVDYYTNKPDARGLAKAATIIRAARKENPQGTLLVDSGDTIQGTPLEYVHNKMNNAPADPMMLSMNALRFDAMAVGNHEYNFGLGVLAKARGEAHFPWLSANTYKAGTDETYYQPYVVKELNGVRVGVLGLTTAGVPSWENRENYAGIEFRAPVAEARKWVEVLRGKERADLVVVAMHMGLEEDLRTGEVTPGQAPHENEAVAVARQVKGIDLILMGHTHREVPDITVGGALLTQANAWGRHVARADVYLERDERGRWRVAAKQARTVPVTERTEVDAEIARIAEPYDREAQGWLARVIGESPAELSAEQASFRDTAILDLIQRVQMEVGKADVSMVANFNPRARLPRGAVSVRDIAGLYIYENTLVVLEVTGRQLKDALEHSAKYFLPYAPGKSAAELVDEKIPGFNFDIAEGVTYDLDLTKPTGQRIQNLRFRGQPLNPAQKLRLATNNYRVNGGGGYTMYKGAPEVFRSSEEIRELIIDWVAEHKRVPSEPTNNWRLVTSN